MDVNVQNVCQNASTPGMRAETTVKKQEASLLTAVDGSRMQKEDPLS